MGAIPIKRNPPTAAESSPERAYFMTTAMLALIVALGHWKPALAWPHQALWLSGGLLLLALLAILVALGEKMSLKGLAAPALALTLFAAWAWLRTERSPTPAQGYPILGSYIQAILFFWMGAFLVRGNPSRAASSRTSFGPLAIAWFFTFLALLFSLHAIWEYHIYFPAEFARQQAAGALESTDTIREGIAYALGLGRVGSKFGNPNVLCGFLAMCLPLMAAATHDLLGRTSNQNRAALWGAIACAFGLVFYAAFRTGSMGGALTMLLAILMIGGALWASKRKSPSTIPPKPRKNSPTIALVLLTGFAFFFPLTHPGVILPRAAAPSAPTTQISEETAPQRSTLEKLLHKAKTIEQRVLYLQIAASIWREEPLLGAGVGGYVRLYPSHRILGAGETQYAHNFIAQTLVETGLIGLGLMLCFLSLFAARLWVGLRSGEASALWLALAGGLILFLFDSLGDYLFYVREPHLDFYLLAGAFFAIPIGSSKTPSGPASRSRFIPIAVLACGVLLVVGSAWRVQVKPLMSEHYYKLNSYSLDDFRWAQTHDPRQAPVLLQQARDFADRALAWEPASKKALQARAYIHAITQQPALALKDLNAAAAASPGSASVQSQLADHYWNQRDRTMALRHIDQAIALHPLKSPYHVQRARYLKEMGRAAEALASAREADRVAFSPKEQKESQEVLDELAGAEAGEER